MDAYEATKTVYQRIQTLDPQNASKIMGVLLIQDHGEKEMIRLAFGPESLVQSVILKARKDLNLSPPNMPSSPSSLSRQNSSVNLPSPLSITTSASASWGASSFSDDLISPSTMNSQAAPFYGSSEVDLIDELHLQDQLSFLNDAPKSSDFYNQELTNDVVLFPPFLNNHHRRSCSVSDIYMGGSDELSGGFGWKPCLFYARGYCKNGTSCRFVHGGEGGGAAAGEGGGVVVGSPSKFEMMEQCQEMLLRSKSTQQQQQKMVAESQLMGSNSFGPSTNKCVNFLMQQQQLQSDNSPRAMMMGRARAERGEFGMNCVNPGSRQIYLTFPADSTFKEEDVSNYFSNFGPVQDVRIPYQQKRMFGFVTFEYPDTVKLILAKGNPHFVCDARVLVKPYKEKGKIPDKHRKQQQQMERGDFAGCGSPTGLDSRDPYDLQLGARMFYNTQDMLWRRKLEEQADLQQAIELQNRRIMSLQLLDVKRNSHHRTLSTGAVISSPTFSPRFLNQNVVISSNRSSPEAKEENGSFANPANFTTNDHEMRRTANGIEKDKDFYAKDENSNDKEVPPPKDKDFQESSEHNLPDSPFASPKAAHNYATAFSNGGLEKGVVVSTPSSTNNNLITGPSLFPATSSLDMPPFKSCYFQLPRFASGHETIGM